MPISIGTDTRAAVFGYGVEGQASVRWLASRGVVTVTVIATDRPPELPAGASWRPESDDGGLDGIDLLVKSPGIKPSHRLLEEASRRGVLITTATRIFVESVREAAIPIVGVTGSKGKSTTATLIHLALDAAGVESVLVGNIGRAALDALPDVLARRPVVVFEMSSYQTHDLTQGPSVAVVTRLFPEHLDWHGGKEAYYASKLNIARVQHVEDVTIWNATDEELAPRVPLGPARHVPYGEEPGVVFDRGTFQRGRTLLFDDRGMKLLGRHNRLNVCAAFTAAELFGAGPRDMQEVIVEFPGLPHRLEDLGFHHGIRWINDSISTAPEAAVAALEGVGPEVATYVGGGTDRGFDFTPLARALAESAVGEVVLLPPGGPAVEAALVREAPTLGARVRLVADLAEAVAVADRATPAGRTVLFSPASPSYGVFRNFEERGEIFRALVRRLGS
jgi:UDP-N-acetylmuramoylalanine--D-glutamate ligase